MTEVQWAVREIATDEEIPEPELCAEADEPDVEDEGGSGDGTAQ
jgi:hypothetical protein